MRGTVEAGSLADQYARPGYGIENLPYASFCTADGIPRLGVRIGDKVLDIAAVVANDGRATAKLLSAVDGPNLDKLLAAGRNVWDELRALLTRQLGSAQASVGLHTFDVEAISLFMPFTVADYVDFYASEFHAANVGQMFRPGQEPLTPNWKHLPIGYHGRAGTIVPSGTDFPRPKGLRPGPDGNPTFGPTRKLDIEAEVGFVVGGAAPDGEVPLDEVGDHLFGVVLVNDWSARDIQAFEYVPLGPFLGKSFATSISLWVVPMAALTAARISPPARENALAPYLDDQGGEAWALDISLEISLADEVISRPTYASMYWTPAQMLAHMTVNGAGQRPGDFFSSGTVSGPARQQRGSFLELSWNGTEPLTLKSGRKLTFLEDKDEVVIRGTAPGPGGTTINIGEVAGRILPPTV
ncbi:fumarylacetoacetase [Paenarthrobacter nicotinovorans]|uniref:fumarylacetoacetase n=1 Tax=Paenarthrobacter nicotinovorans TaxID=29320 RepID=UPI00381C7F04